MGNYIPRSDVFNFTDSMHMFATEERPSGPWRLHQLLHWVPAILWTKLHIRLCFVLGCYTLCTSITLVHITMFTIDPTGETLTVSTLPYDRARDSIQHPPSSVSERPRRLSGKLQPTYYSITNYLHNSFALSRPTRRQATQVFVTLHNMVALQLSN